jgi:hypothetical protein
MKALGFGCSPATDVDGPTAIHQVCITLLPWEQLLAVYKHQPGNGTLPDRSEVTEIVDTWSLKAGRVQQLGITWLMPGQL